MDSLGLAAAQQVAEQAMVDARRLAVRIGGRLAGAVAVSGATSVQDHEIAARAAAEVGGLR